MSRRLALAAVLVCLAVLSGCDGAGSARLDVDDVRRSAIPRGTETARVVSHVDGDTVRLARLGLSATLAEGEASVRLLEIDTPELSHTEDADDCYAVEASEALATLLPVGDEVHVMRDAELLDPYDRTLLYLWTEDGVFVNEELVRLGYARAVLYEPNDRYIEQIRAAEREARDADRGLWGAC